MTDQDILHIIIHNEPPEAARELRNNSEKHLSGSFQQRLLINGLKMTDSQRLLDEYVKTGSETAFRELVARYINLVYSVAVRLTNGDRHLAEDISQTVFADLARKARTLSGDVMLGGWLHRHTCFVTSTFLRTQRRRQHREMQAAHMNTLDDHSEANLAQVAPILDEAINQLGAQDRAAIVLRFYEQRDFRSVGEGLGSNEEAARKRVTRALEKLRFLMQRRGVALSTASLGTLLAAEAVTAAPAGLAITVSATALTAGVVGGGTAITIINLFAMTKIKIAVLGTLVAAGLTTQLVVQQKSLAKLQTENQELRQRDHEMAQLREENARLATLQTDKDELDRLRRGQSDLARLRGMVGTLNRQLAMATNQAPAAVKRESSRPAWKLKEPRQIGDFNNVGTETPEATCETILWAAKNQPGELAKMIHLPSEMLQVAESQNANESLGLQLATMISSWCSSVSGPSSQVWLDGGSKTSIYSSTSPGVTNVYDNILAFRLTGRENSNDPSTEHFTLMNLKKIDGAFKLVITGLSPESKESKQP